MEIQKKYILTFNIVELTYIVFTYVDGISNWKQLFSLNCHFYVSVASLAEAARGQSNRKPLERKNIVI